jgi:rubrerythrin
MVEFKSIEDILDFAIKDEQRASDLYAGLAQRSRNKEIQKVFEQFSKEELGHKKRLESIKGGGAVVISNDKIQDLKIGDYLVEVNTSRDDLSYQEALIVAMKEEKAAFRLYSDLAARTSDAGLKELFLMLAQEEAKHKLRFEIEYDDYVLTEN